MVKSLQRIAGCMQWENSDAPAGTKHGLAPAAALAVYITSTGIKWHPACTSTVPKGIAQVYSWG